jgi:hypothetical protein
MATQGMMACVARAKTRDQDLNGLEQAIRNALDRADRGDSEIRARIYQSARNALLAGLAKQEISDPQVINRQKRRLEATIGRIEEEEVERIHLEARIEREIADEAGDDLVADEPPDDSDGQEDVELEPVPETAAPAVIEEAVPPQQADEIMPADDGSLGDFGASRDAKPQPARHEEEDPAWAAPASPAGAQLGEKTRSRRRRSGSLIVSLFVYSVLIGAVAGGVWWVYATGMVDAFMKGNTDFDLIPKELQTEDFDPAEQSKPLDPQRSFSGEWRDIFKPAQDASAVSARLKAEISQSSDSDGAFTQIASGTPDQDGDVLIEVPPSVLPELGGRTTTLAVTLKAIGDKPAQIYIQCEFGTLGGCGRHRFSVPVERSDELIQIKLDNKRVPDEKAVIVINTDLTGQGGAIKLYGIRYLPGQ